MLYRSMDGKARVDSGVGHLQSNKLWKFLRQECRKRDIGRRIIKRGADKLTMKEIDAE